VTLWAPETRVSVTGRYSKPPQVVAERAANGAWTAIPRLKRRPLSSWSGPQLVKIECEVRFDGFDRGQAVGPDLLVLRSLQDRLPGDGAPDRPPYLELLGYAPGHYTSEAIAWQIDGLEISEDEHLDGVCVQALAKITLAEWIDPDIRVRVQATRSASRPYSWRRGDTLARVAKRELGSASAQAQNKIRAANPRIRSWTTVPAGKRITIPATTTTNR
jgi:hypothetical protein